MADTRREFLRVSGMGVLGIAAAAVGVDAQEPAQQPVPGATPAFGTSPAVGPKVTAETFAEAEKLVQVANLPAERAEMASNWQQSMAALFERRVGPRKVELAHSDTPATNWEPWTVAPQRASLNAGMQPGQSPQAWPLPHRDDEIAFATVAMQSQWIRTKQLSSERLTKIYLERLKVHNKALNCVITLCEEHALTQARAADAEIAAGRYRGPLHGIPWGAKDLLDTAGIATTWGAEPFRDRIPSEDADVTKELNRAGAVLVAKLSLGAFALNDVWFGGQTKNPWCLEEGSSGSSAGPASAVGAGLVSFAIGSETQGSIISPSMRCGVTGLRPTYSHVSTKGAMPLSWTCDKLGPLARCVEDTVLVLAVIGHYGYTNGLVDATTRTDLKGLRVGYIETWQNDPSTTDVDRHALDVLKKLGVTLVPVSLPDWPYDSLNTILFAEAAAAFEAETLDGRVRELTMQVPDAWPNTFRQARFLSAVDFVQADRLRRKVAVEVAKMFEGIDVLLTPSLLDAPMVIFNFTGHPSLTLRAGFVEIGEARSDWAPDPKHPLPKFSPKRRVPYGVTLVGRLFDEGTLGRLGMAMEREFGVAAERPAGF